MLILVLLGMYFDAAVVFVKTFLLLFRLALDLCSDILIIFLLAKIKLSNCCLPKFIFSVVGS